MSATSGFGRKHQRAIPYLIVMTTLSLIVVLEGLTLWQKQHHSIVDFLLIGLEGVALCSVISLFYLPLHQIGGRRTGLSLVHYDDTLADVENRLIQTQAVTQSGDWVLNAFTKEMFWSEQMSRIFGDNLRQSPLHLEDFFHQIPAPEREPIRDAFQRSLTQGGAFSVEHAVVCPDRTKRHVICRGNAVQSQAGEVIRLVGTVCDVTSQKQLERALQASENRLNDIFNTTTVGIFKLRVYRDRTWLYDAVSSGVEAIYGYTPAEFLAHPTRWQNVLHPSDRDAVIALLCESCFAEQHTQVEFQICTKNGETRWVNRSTFAHRDADQNYWRVTAVDIDITDRKQLIAARRQAEQDMRQQTALLRQVIDSIPHLLFVKDEAGRFILANRPAAEVHGTSPEQLLGRREIEFNHHLKADWLSAIIAINQTVMNHQRSQTLPETQLIDHTGQPRWYQLHLTPCLNIDGQVQGVIGNALDVTDRKRLGLALETSEAQLGMTLNAAKASIISYRLYRDYRWEYLYVSSGCQTILGYTAAEIMTEPTLWQSRVVPEDWETVFIPVLEDLFAERPVSLEYRFLHRDGKLRWLASRITSQYEPATDAWVVTLVDIDISDRKQVEQALGESQQLLQRILDSVPQAIFWKDRQSTYLGCNQNFARYAGLQTPAEIVGKTDYELPWLPKEAAHYQQIDREVMTTGEAQLHILEQQHPADGNEIWIETSKVPLEDVTGQIIGILGTYEDITQRQATKAALHYSEARLRAVFEQSTVGLAFMAPSGQFLQVNPAYTTMTGYSKTELLTMTCSEIVHPDDGVQFQSQIEQLLNGEEAALCLEIRYCCKDGQHRWVNLNLSAIRVHADNVLSFLASIAVDITDRKQTEQVRLQQTTQEQAFNRVVKTIRSSLDLKTIFATAVHEAANLLEICRVGIVQYQPERHCWQHVMEYRCREDIPDTLGLEIPDLDNPFAEQLKRFEVVHCDATETITDPINQGIAEQFPGSWLLVPLIVNDTIWGSFSLFHEPSLGPFADHQIELIKRLADQIAIAIQQANLYSQLQTANQQLQYLATHDSLTQLTNRRYFDDQLQGKWERLLCTVESAWLALILCDIDYFKQYNDFYGHLQGDNCLILVAQALRQGIQRPADIISRYGGEEFAIILPATDDTGAIHVVQQLQAAIAALDLPHAASEISHQVTLSFGIACVHKAASARLSTTTDETFSTPIHIADQALYQAKSQGRNRYQISLTSL